MDQELKSKIRHKKADIIKAGKNLLPPQVKMNELEAYWRKAKFNDDIAGVHRICLQCKKGSSKKIENCRTTWCNCHDERFTFVELLPEPGSTAIPAEDRVSIQDSEPDGPVST